LEQQSLRFVIKFFMSLFLGADAVPITDVATRRNGGSAVSAAKRLWALNGDFLALRPTGVARYAREVTLAIDRLIGEGHPAAEGLDLTLIAPREPDGLSLRHIPLHLAPEFRKPRLPQYWVQRQLPAAVRGGLVSFCNLAPVTLRRHIACIHDAHTFVMPESYGRGFRLAHRIVLPLLGRRARYIMTVSELSRDHLIRYGIAPADKIVVGYNGADHAARWDASRSALDVGDHPYVVCLGQPQTYKNAGLILRMAPALQAMGLAIAMAGDIRPQDLPLGGAEPPPNLRLLGRVSDDDLAKLLAGAVCFLFPSRIEGFGLPAVEAMTHGCPVIASTSPCLPEICADGALYADPDSPQEWAETVRMIHIDPQLRQRLAERGRRRAARFTWTAVAETYLRLMAQIDAEG
jgi:glycosyltransferase involved in cell wall biosynthesis